MDSVKDDRHMRHATIVTMMGVCAVLLSSCAPAIYEQAGYGQEKLASDAYECRVQWDQSAMGQQFARDPLQYASYGFMARSEMQRCLEHRGWKRKE
jgi:hypothetical protein